MFKKPTSVPANLQPWIDARRKFHLSHAHVQMARELGMNPKKLGKLDNHRQEPWKLPLPQFIAHLYAKRFGKERPTHSGPSRKWQQRRLQRNKQRKRPRIRSA